MWFATVPQHAAERRTVAGSTLALGVGGPGRVVAQAPNRESGRESRIQRWPPVSLMLMGVYERAGERPGQAADSPPGFTFARLDTESMGG